MGSQSWVQMREHTAHYPYSSDEEREAQRDSMTCPRTHNEKWQDQNLTSGDRVLKILFLATRLFDKEKKRLNIEE